MTPENILAPHRERTLRRMQEESVVLCWQDGPDLNLAGDSGCVGLGLVRKNAKSKGTRGIHMHSTLAESAAGIPLGVPQIQCDAPDGKTQLHWQILKSGCKVEDLGHRTGERVERMVTIKAVIAWRLAAMTLMGREAPELPSKVYFARIQLRVLTHLAPRRKLTAPGNLGLAVRTMASPGGYLYRKNARPPSRRKIWVGRMRLRLAEKRSRSVIGSPIERAVLH